MRQVIANNLRGVKLTILLSVLFLNAMAQTAIITGKIVDGKTKEPLAFASVFFDNTTVGTVTDTSGMFSLSKPNANTSYDLVISFVGYNAYNQRINAGNQKLDLGEITMSPAEIELNAVEVEGSRDKTWEKQLKRFTKAFLGDDELARESKIVNPWVLEFEETGKRKGLRAIAGAPIEIDNLSLGYRINFYLNDYMSDKNGYLIEGNTKFTELQTQDKDEAVNWKANRNLAYWHSPHHLFKAMIDSNIKGEGFHLYTERPGQNPTVRWPDFYDYNGETVLATYDTLNLVRSTEVDDVFQIAIKKRIEVHYHKKRAPVRTYRDIAYAVSWIELTGGDSILLVNKNGYPLDPTKVIVSGAMSENRVARMVPIDYRPNGNAQMEKIDLSWFQEKIYVHTDKPYYYPGEVMWFKGYVNYATPAWRDSLSRTVYVELIGLNKKIALSKTIPIEGGFFYNDFILPKDFEAGAYYLRAYTNFNRNLGDSSLFMKYVPVLNLTDLVNEVNLIEDEVEDNAISISTNKESYAKRDKIELTLTVRDEDGDPLEANLSISVIDVKQVIPIRLSPNIMDGFALKEIAKREYDGFFPFPIEYGINFSGRFYDTRGEPETTTLNVMDLKSQNAVLTQSNEDGIFTVRDLIFYDSTDFFIQKVGESKDNKGRVGEVARQLVPVSEFPDSPTLNLIETEFPQRIISEYEVPKDARILEEVVIKGQKAISEVRKRSYGRADYVLKAKDINTSYGSLLTVLPGKFPGLIVRQASSEGGALRWVIYNNRGLSLARPSEVLITLNDAPVQGENPANFLETINPNIVESVEYTARISPIYGSQGAGGVLAIYTKTDIEVEEIEKTPNFQILRVAGYSPARKFKFPDYDSESTDKTMVDYRSTIYWNPNVTADAKTGTAEVSFFAADLPGKYRVVVEGMTYGGVPIRGEYFLTIQSK